jgi:hypothetical protein
MDKEKTIRRIRYGLVFFVCALAVSGITAIPLVWEINILQNLFGRGSWFSSIWPAMANWISFVYQGIQQMAKDYPFLQYGTDWLAFAHIVIAVAFLGAIKDPQRNIWVVEFGMIACVLIIPTAMIFGAIRGIPFYWRLFDCSFGIFGIIPLWLVRSEIKKLDRGMVLQ